MTCRKSPEVFGREENKKCVLDRCEGTRHDGQSRQSVSPKSFREVMKSKEAEGHDPSEEERSAENNKRKENILQGLQPTEDFGQEGHHNLRRSGCMVEQDNSSVHEDQRENVVRGAPPREGTSEDEEPFPVSGTADVSTRSRGKAESSAGTPERPTYISQVAVAFLLAWGLMSSCTGVSFPGAVLSQFTDPDTDDLYLEPQTLALFVSIPQVGTVTGSLISGQLLVPLGPRVTILIGLALGLATWLGLVFSSQLWVLMMCRFLAGCAFAFVKPPAVMYMVEVAHESFRGRLVGVLGFAREIGFLSSYILGGLNLTWRQLSFVYACSMVLSVIGVFLLPSSPRWLTTRGSVNKARKSLVFFRGRHFDVETELLEVVRQADAAGVSSSTWQQLRLLARSGTLRMFLLMLTYFAFYALNGVIVLNSYMMIILNAPGTPIDPSLGSVLCSIFKITGTIVYILIVDYFGRVPIIVVSFSFSAVCTAAYGYFFILMENDNTGDVSWLPLTSIVVFMFFSGVVVSVLDVLQGELLPNSCRAVSMPILALANGLTTFTVLQMFPQLLEVLGMNGLFGFFAAVNLALTVLGVVALPETRGMSLEAISDAVHHLVSSNTDVTGACTNMNQHDLTKQNVEEQADDVSLTSVVHT